MSPTRKPKPPDKGAPIEHKPSRKVALEEVMRSLQDLVSNELATEPVTPPGDVQATQAKTKHAAHVEKPPVARSAYSADLLPTTPPIAAKPTAESESITLDDSTLPMQPVSASPAAVDELPDLGAEPPTTLAEPPATTSGDVPLGGLQQELPYLEAAPPATSASLPAPTPEAADAEIASFLPQVLNVDDANIVAGANNPATATGETNWDDFPVLEEVVEIDTDAVDLGADSSGAPVATAFVQTATNLPTAEAAHRLAIQVAARLNVELRKSGQGGLNSDVITRLARLLQEALAKSAPNMENTTVNEASLTDGGSDGSAGAVFRPPSDKH